MRVGRSPRSLRPQPPLVAKPAVTASSGAGEVTPDAESAVVDFAPPAGTKWPPESRIHRACEEATRALPECSPGTTGESWAALAARAHQLIGKRVSIQDRLLVGPPTDQVDERDCRPFDHAYPHGEHRPGCDSDRRALVLGEGDPPLFLFRRYCRGDESRLCCDARAYGQTVVATGVLGLGYDKDWSLEPATICTVPERRKP